MLVIFRYVYLAFLWNHALLGGLDRGSCGRIEIRIAIRDARRGSIDPPQIMSQCAASKFLRIQQRGSGVYQSASGRRSFGVQVKNCRVDCESTPARKIDMATIDTLDEPFKKDILALATKHAADPARVLEAYDPYTSVYTCTLPLKEAVNWTPNMAIFGRDYADQFAGTVKGAVAA